MEQNDLMQRKQTILRELREITVPAGEVARERAYRQLKCRFQSGLPALEWDWLSRQIADRLGI